MQVLCNGGVATEIALLYLVKFGAMRIIRARKVLITIILTRKVLMIKVLLRLRKFLLENVSSVQFHSQDPPPKSQTGDFR